MSAGGKPGRKRSEEAREAILEATRDELAERGYDRLSFDRIAAAAGVGKQTIYRWYASKNALVAECILRGRVIPLSIPVVDSGDVRQDVAAWLDAFAAESRAPLAAELMRAGTAAAAEDEVIAARYAEVTDATEGALVARLRSGISAGQLPSGTPASTLAEMIIGALVFRVLARQEITSAFTGDLMRIIFRIRSE
ncbi:TetR/AcrR family transcriptional regulator [Streptomyces sp. NPDC060322]|uniref:TetR/AcrR family transcriptional regulator n=1 Tax=Streptomyces sp. NPDC060322 TaxID=3347097 RepID=UPI00364768E0